MAQKQTQPIGIELAKRRIITENDIEKALEYQRNNPGKKLGDVINILGLCDSEKLIKEIGDILGERAILLEENDVKINVTDLNENQKSKLRGAIKFFSGDRNNIVIKIIKGDEELNSGGIYINEAIFNEIVSIVGKERAVLE